MNPDEDPSDRFDRRADLRAVLSGSAASDLAEQLGAFYSDLLLDGSWIARRVESIKIVDLSTREHRTSIDVDVPELRKRAKDHQLDRFEELPIPLGFLPKGLLLDLDTRDRDGRSISLFTSDEDSRLAQLALRALARKLPNWPADQRAAAEVETFFLEAALELPSQHAAASFDARALHNPPSHRRASAAARSYWSDVLPGQPQLQKLMETFQDNFASVVWFPLAGSTDILKYRWVEAELDSAQELRGDVSRSRIAAGRVGPTWPFYLHLLNIGRATREHTRIQAPDGTFFHPASVLVPVRGGTYELEYKRRLTLSELIFYTRGLPVGDYYVRGYVVPELRGYMGAAAWLSTTTALLLLGGGIAQLRYESLQIVQKWVDAAVPILLILPTIFIAYLIRDNEHSVRRRLLRSDRFLIIAASMVPLLTAMISLFFSWGKAPGVFGLLWMGLSVLPVAMLVKVLVGGGRIARRRRSVETRGSRTNTIVTEQSREA